MELLRRFFPWRRHASQQALETRETIHLPIDILIVGSLHSDTPDTKPIKSQTIIPANVTTIRLGQTRLIHIANLEPDKGLNSIQFTNRQEIKRGKSLTLPDGLLVAIPYPKFLLSGDGRVYYEAGYIESHEPSVEMDRKINAVRQVIQYQKSYARQLTESAPRRT